MTRSLAHFLGFFFPDSAECCICGELGGHVAWLCRGEVLVAELCRAHADRVPRTPTQVDDIFGEVYGPGRGRLYTLRGSLRRGGQAA